MSDPKAPIKGTILIKKLVDVAKIAKTVKKSGYNQHQDYHYSTEEDLIDVIKDELLNRGIFIFTTSKITQVDRLTKVKTDKNGGKEESTSLVTSVETVHTFFDSESGESYSVASAGSGHDPTDKGVFKAITGATKYFISKNFLIASKDDPEGDGEKKPAAPAAKPSGGSLFGAKKVEPKKEVAAPTNEVKVESTSGNVSGTTTPIATPAVTAQATEAPKVEAAPTPAPTTPIVAKTLTQRKPVFNKNKADNASVKF